MQDPRIHGYLQDREGVGVDRMYSVRDLSTVEFMSMEPKGF